MELCQVFVGHCGGALHSGAPRPRPEHSGQLGCADSLPEPAKARRSTCAVYCFVMRCNWQLLRRLLTDAKRRCWHFRLQPHACSSLGAKVPGDTAFVSQCRYVHAGLLYASLDARTLASHVACVEVRSLTKACLILACCHTKGLTQTPDPKKCGSNPWYVCSICPAQ